MDDWKPETWVGWIGLITLLVVIVGGVIMFAYEGQQFVGIVEPVKRHRVEMIEGHRYIITNESVTHAESCPCKSNHDSGAQRVTR